MFLSIGWSTAQSIPRQVLSGHVPPPVARLQPLGRLDGASRLKLSINLPLRDQAGLANLLDQLYDPASPEYRHFLTPDDFNARFGPTEDDYQAVIAWAKRSGFSITGLHESRLLLEVTAPAASIESALQVKLQTYAHPTESRTFFAADRDPSLDAGLPVAYIEGLNNFSHPHPKNLRHGPLKKSARATPKMGSGPNGNLAGFDYRAAYAAGVTNTGAGQMVGLVEFDGYFASDIASYESQTGLPNVPLQPVLLDGFDGVPTPPSDPTSGNSEVALDIEMAISMAPGLSKVVVYESDTNGFPSNMLLAMSTNTVIKQFGCSWDFGNVTTAQRTSMDTYFQKFDAQGQAFFDASGDSGVTNSTTEAPDDDPYITQVGGTTLATAGPGGAWLSEVAWNAGEGPGYAGTSGGVSTHYTIPAWQKGINMTTNKGSTTFRNYPDVSMVADDVFIVADDGTNETTGGTSCSAPLWAGFMALANQQAVAVGGATNSVGFLNPAIYHIGTNSSYHACVNDITFGNNTNFNAANYFAVPGYDLCTGWGSPVGGSLIIALTEPDGLQLTPGQGPVANGPIGGPFNITNVTFVLTNTGKSALNWTLGSTSTWVNVSSHGGTLTPGGATNAVSVTLNPVVNLLPAGVYPVNLWFTNLSSGLVQTRQFNLQVSEDLVQDGGFESGDFCYWNTFGAEGVYSNEFAYVEYDNFVPYAGNYYAALGQVGSLGWLSQSLATRAGQIYQLSLWLESPENETPNQFQVMWNTNSTTTNIVFNQLNMGSFGWSNLLFTVKAWTNVTTLQIGGRNDNSYFALDSVSVLPVPAPAVQALNAGKKSFQLAWTALPGVAYQVQYLTNLLTTNWVNLGSTITATNNPMYWTETNGPNQKGFYRVELLP
jgi:hypothetical protein